jgi:hypothetical protein
MLWCGRERCKPRHMALSLRRPIRCGSHHLPLAHPSKACLQATLSVRPHCPWVESGAIYHDASHHGANPGKENVEQEADGRPCLCDVRHTLPPAKGKAGLAIAVRHNHERANGMVGEHHAPGLPSDGRICRARAVDARHPGILSHFVSSQASVKTSIVLHLWWSKGLSSGSPPNRVPLTAG